MLTHQDELLMPMPGIRAASVLISESAGSVRRDRVACRRPMYAYYILSQGRHFRNE